MEPSPSFIPNFPASWSSLPALPLNHEGPIDYFFEIRNGKSTGEKNYLEGELPYISSGDESNSIIRLVQPEPEQVFPAGGITVTAFGQAYLQPWPFLARGNGGSAVRVLIPRYRMSLREILWFTAQVNSQRWRFFYGRMAIKSRIKRLIINSPPQLLPDGQLNIADRLRNFKAELIAQSTGIV